MSGFAGLPPGPMWKHNPQALGTALRREAVRGPHVVNPSQPVVLSVQRVSDDWCLADRAQLRRVRERAAGSVPFFQGPIGGQSAVREWSLSQAVTLRRGLSSSLCKRPGSWCSDVGVDAVWVDDRELLEGLLPVRGDLTLDEPARCSALGRG